MGRRLLLASGDAGTIPDPLPGGGEPSATTPIPSYTIPTFAPFNVGVVASTPTSDETGEAMHPDVWDAGPDGWNGKRYWLATTAFSGAINANENPHILCSNNGWDFVWPTPGINPLADWPGRATDNNQWYNSDTDIHHDPDTDELVVTWREARDFDGRERIYLTASSNGTTWSTPVVIWETSGAGLTNVSQSLIKVGPSEWRMYFYQVQKFYTATSRLGPYGSPQTFTLSGHASGYHGDVIKHGSRYYALYQVGGNEFPATSTDGITFTSGEAILTSGIRQGLYQEMYRSCMQVDPINPTKVGVWYGAHENDHAGPGTVMWNTAYTRVPLNKWPTL